MNYSTEELREKDSAESAKATLTLLLDAIDDEDEEEVVVLCALAWDEMEGSEMAHQLVRCEPSSPLHDVYMQSVYGEKPSSARKVKSTKRRLTK